MLKKNVLKKLKKTFDEGQTKWEKISKNYLDKIERLHAEVNRYHGLKQQAETNGNAAKVSEYENLIKKNPR